MIFFVPETVLENGGWKCGFPIGEEADPNSKFHCQNFIRRRDYFQSTETGGGNSASYILGRKATSSSSKMGSGAGDKTTTSMGYLDRIVPES